MAIRVPGAIEIDLRLTIHFSIVLSNSQTRIQPTTPPSLTQSASFVKAGITFLLAWLAGCIISLSSAQEPRSSGAECPDDVWSSLARDIKKYTESTNSSISAQAIAAEMHKLANDAPPNVLAHVNEALVLILATSSNASPWLKQQFAECSFSVKRPVSGSQDEQYLNCAFTNKLLLIRVLEHIYGGLDPGFDPQNAPSNRIPPPLELLAQGIDLNGADRSYTNSPIWLTAVARHKSAVKFHQDQVDRRKFYRSLLHDVLLLSTKTPHGSEQARVLTKVINNTILTPEHKRALIEGLIGEPK